MALVDIVMELVVVNAINVKEMLLIQHIHQMDTSVDVVHVMVQEKLTLDMYPTIKIWNHH